mgnify:CR=1 FL=1
MKKKSWVSLIISAAVLTAMLVLGFGSGVFQPEALSVQGRQGAETLLRLLTMAAAVLLVEKLAVAILGLLHPAGSRARSLITLSMSILRYAAALVILCWGLTILGVNIMAVVASVGVLALIVGFSAESLIADMVTGLFMLFENQYNVGGHSRGWRLPGHCYEYWAAHHLHHGLKRQYKNREQFGYAEYSEPLRAQLKGGCGYWNTV